MRFILAITLLFSFINSFSMNYKKETWVDNDTHITICPPSKMVWDDKNRNYKEIEIGWIHYTIQKKADCPSCYVKYLRIEDEHQKKGLGRELMRQALEDMKQHGCTKVTLDSYSNAVGFYEKLGFKHKMPLILRWLYKPSVLPMKYTFDSK